MEKQRHRVLDVVFREDQLTLYDRIAIQHVAFCNRLAVSLLKQQKSRDTLKVRRKMASWDVVYLKQILSIFSV